MSLNAMLSISVSCLGCICNGLSGEKDGPHEWSSYSKPTYDRVPIVSDLARAQLKPTYDRVAPVLDPARTTKPQHV